MQHPEGYVKTYSDHGIATIEFYHPASNSLPGAILRDLAKTINDMGVDANIKVLILRSAGDRAFCAGASFDELAAIKNEQEGKEFFSGFAHVINAIRKSHKFVIGRVQGKAVGGGVGLAAAVDYCIATEAASVRLSELDLGIGPFVVGPAVERKIGTSSYSQLAIDAGEWRSADWAKRKGLYAEMHPNTADMDDAVKHLADRLAHSSLEAMAELKKVFWKGCENWDTLLVERAAISGRLILGEHSQAAIRKIKAAKPA